MTTWYIQTIAPVTDSGDITWGRQYSSGDGSIGSPYGSLLELINNETIGDNDVIYIDTETSGYPCYGTHIIEDASNPIITRKPGLTGVQRIVNGRPLDLSTLESTDGTYDVYRTEAGSLTALPNRISQNWNVNVNGMWQRYGVLDEQASAAALKEAYGFYYNATTDTLYVSIPNGADIADYEHIVGHNGHVLLVNDAPYPTSKHLSVEHAFDPTATQAYGIRYDGGSTGGLIQYCVSDGIGYHGLGSVADDPTGFKLLNNQCRTAAPTCDSQLIAYVGASGGQINCEMAYNTIDLDPWLGWDGTFTMGDTDNGVVGIGCHTTTLALDTPVGGLKIHHNTTRWSGHNPTVFSPDLMFVAANTKHGGRPSDINDRETYSVQLYNNSWNGMGMIVGGGDGNETWVSSYHDAWNVQAGLCTDGTGTTAYIGSTQGASSDNGIHMIASTISGALDTSSVKALIHVGAKFFMTNCSVHVRGTGHNGSSRMINFSSSATEAGFNGCLFSCEQTGFRLSTGSWLNIWANAAAAAAGWNDNWYDPNFAIQFNNTTGNNRTIFQSTIDPDGEYVETIGYVSDLTLEPDTDTRAVINATKPTGPDGINLGAGLYGVYSQAYGAFQYGPAPVSSSPGRSTGIALGSIARSSIAN